MSFLVRIDFSRNAARDMSRLGTEEAESLVADVNESPGKGHFRQRSYAEVTPEGPLSLKARADCATDVPIFPEINGTVSGGERMLRSTWMFRYR